jgi:hypothetical protein
MAFDIIPDPRFLWWGAARAQGVFVWGHGRGAGDSRGLQPQPYTRWFNNAGFTGDNFVPDPDARSALVQELLPSHVGHVLWLDRPDGITGHGGGNTWQFNDRFGGCILRFVTAATPLGC